MGSYKLVGPADTVLTLYFRANDVPRAEIMAARANFWAHKEGVIFKIGAKTEADAEALRVWLEDRAVGG
jgi:hypothetical protein